MADEYRQNSNLSHRQIYFLKKVRFFVELKKFILFQILKIIDNIKYNSAKKLDKIKADVIALYKTQGKSEIFKGISDEDIWVRN